MNFLNLLEEKHFGRLKNTTVFQLANNDKNFAEQWLIHAIRSDCHIKELACAIAAAIKWQVKSIKLLKEYLSNIKNSSEPLNSNCIDAITYSEKHIQNFCLNEQQHILYNLINLKNLVTYQTAIGVNKYTCQINLPIKLLNTIITISEPHLKSVTLFGAQGKSSSDKQIRNNTHFPTPLPNNVIELALLENILALSTGKSLSYAEIPVILKYINQQYYHWHYDYIYPHTNDIEQHIKQFGQRDTTAIFYLNDHFTGGETEFKQPYISITPEQNKALIFKNVDNKGNRDKTSIHRGCEVTDGEKWIVTLWFRDKAYWLRSGLLN